MSECAELELSTPAHTALRVLTKQANRQGLVKAPIEYRRPAGKFLLEELEEVGALRCKPEGIVLLRKFCRCSNRKIHPVACRPPIGGSVKPNISIDDLISERYKNSDPLWGSTSNPQKRYRRVADWTAADLSRYFNSEMRYRHRDVPNPVNLRATDGAFARWRRDGLESETIKAMIDIFVKETWWKDSEHPPWKAFVWKRQRYQRAVEKGRRKKMSEYDDTYDPAAALRDWEARQNA